MWTFSPFAVSDGTFRAPCVSIQGMCPHPWMKGGRIKKTWHSTIWLQLPDLASSPVPLPTAMFSSYLPAPVYYWHLFSNDKEVFQPLLEQSSLCGRQRKAFPGMKDIPAISQAMGTAWSTFKGNQIPALEPAWSYSYELYSLVRGS